MVSRNALHSSAVGLCIDCQHVRVMRSDRGTEFYLCRRGLTEPGFAKYPRLPVRDCVGYDAAAVNQSESPVYSGKELS